MNLTTGAGSLGCGGTDPLSRLFGTAADGRAGLTAAGLGGRLRRMNHESEADIDLGCRACRRERRSPNGLGRLPFIHWALDTPPRCVRMPLTPVVMNL